MAELAILSTIANVSAIVGLSDCICRLSLRLYSLFKRGMSSANVGQLLSEIQTLVSLVSQIRGFLTCCDGLREFALNVEQSDSSLEAILTLCEQELRVLDTLATSTIADPKAGLLVHLKSAWRFAAEDQTVAESSRRLQRLILSLNTALSLSGR